MLCRLMALARILLMSHETTTAQTTTTDSSVHLLVFVSYERSHYEVLKYSILLGHDDKYIYRYNYRTVLTPLRKIVLTCFEYDKLS